MLDGDEMRYAISEKAGFTQEDRHEHNLRVARLAEVLSHQGFNVIVAVIAPFRDTRRAIEEIIPQVKWIYVKRRLAADPDRPYQAPEAPWLVIDADASSMLSSTIAILSKAADSGLLAGARF